MAPVAVPSRLSAVAAKCASKIHTNPLDDLVRHISVSHANSFLLRYCRVFRHHSKWLCCCLRALNVMRSGSVMNLPIVVYRQQRFRAAGEVYPSNLQVGFAIGARAPSTPHCCCDDHYSGPVPINR